MGGRRAGAAVFDHMARYSHLSAQLAQLVEHFHGKEGVSGSSPELGLALGLTGMTGKARLTGRANYLPSGSVGGAW